MHIKLLNTPKFGVVFTRYKFFAYALQYFSCFLPKETQNIKNYSWCRAGLPEVYTLYQALILLVVYTSISEMQ